MLTFILTFLAASLILYAILGGADFGAGIIEIITPRDLQQPLEQAVYKAIGPIWEANHMWLILAVVILFYGFPAAYAEIATLLHVPLTLMLMAIIVRGCAFTFRHYDAFVDQSTKLYNLAFKYSSLVTTMFIGTIAGAIAKGAFRQADSSSYFAVYVEPWISPFCLSVGLLTCILFAYQASVFLIGEPVDAELKKHCRRRAKQLHAAAIAGGGLVFGLAAIEQVPILSRFSRAAAPFCAFRSPHC